MELGLNGTTVIILGATGGLGAAISLRFAEEQANLILVGRDERKIAKLHFELAQTFKMSKIYSIVADAKTEDGIDKISSCLDEFNIPINGLVTNIGDGRSASSSVSEVDDFNRCWDVNFNSCLLPIYGLKNRIVGASAFITMISSIAGINLVGAPLGYSVAKSAVNALCKNLSVELAPHIRVNAVAPGNIMFKGSTWQKKQLSDPIGVSRMLKSSVPLGRFAEPKEIASSVLFLSSVQAAFITGTVLVVDGGQTVGV